MKLKIMTFNLRTSNAKSDGINSFENRKPYIKALITRHAPHLIGFQEVTDDMLAFLRGELSCAYEIIACGRNENCRGEGVTLAYRRDDFVAVKSETFWLSPTPNDPGSTYGGDQSSCPRITTYVKLKADGADTPFIFANTHFDHLGENARVLEAEQMSEFLKKDLCPVFLTGDFNDFPTSAAIRKLGETLTDLTSDVGATFHNFGAPDYTPVKIDYIFTNIKAPTYTSELISDGPFNGVYPSDHYPVLATIEYN
ncbi:MAG: endonuclease/exonuclease/phosphatase family protein [Clostridia bacterium]|nr:endonuclease/exonuclease/phosphatase family protein [Clostridia bacterium]